MRIANLRIVWRNLRIKYALKSEPLIITLTFATVKKPRHINV